MTPDRQTLDDVRAALDAAQDLEADDALPHLRRAAERLTELIDESLATAVVQQRQSLRSAGARAGLSENAVGPRLARTRSLGAYADDKGRVTASGVERARYDAETGAPPPSRPTPPGSASTQPMRFKPRRPTP